MARSYLSQVADDRFSPVVPAPGHLVALQVDAADPPVDAVEGDLVLLTGKHALTGLGQAHARRALHETARRVEAEQRARPLRHLLDPAEAGGVSQKRPRLPRPGPDECRPRV